MRESRESEATSPELRDLRFGSLTLISTLGKLFVWPGGAGMHAAFPGAENTAPLCSICGQANVLAANVTKKI